MLKRKKEKLRQRKVRFETKCVGWISHQVSRHWTRPEGSSSDAHWAKTVVKVDINMSFMEFVQSLPCDWLIGQLGKVPKYPALISLKRINKVVCLSVCQRMIGQSRRIVKLLGWESEKICKNSKFASFFFFIPAVSHFLWRDETQAWASAPHPQQSEAACGRCPRPALPPARRLLRALQQRSHIMDRRI